MSAETVGIKTETDCRYSSRYFDFEAEMYMRPSKAHHLEVESPQWRIFNFIIMQARNPQACVGRPAFFFFYPIR